MNKCAIRDIVLTSEDGSEEKHFNSTREVAEFLGCTIARVNIALANKINGWALREEGSRQKRLEDKLEKQMSSVLGISEDKAHELLASMKLNG